MQMQNEQTVENNQPATQGFRQRGFKRLNYVELFSWRDIILYTMYCEDGMSLAAIASLFGCSIDDVNREIHGLANIVAKTAQGMM